MEKIKKYIVLSFFCCFTPIVLSSQTLFESAEGEGIINFRLEKKISQLKLNLASTTITYGYYYIAGTNTNVNRFICNAELKLKPNEDGMATLVKVGQMQPGVKLNASFGYRRIFGGSFKVLDIYLKPEYSLTEYSILDSTRTGTGQKSLYKKTSNSYGGNLTLNYGMSLFTNANLYVGVQAGILSTTNADDLTKGTFQTVVPVSDSTSSYATTEVEQIKIGSLKSVTNLPFKFDLILDPGLVLGQLGGAAVRLGLFGYYRSLLNEDKNRVGFGICFLDAQNPSSVFTSLGYELPDKSKPSSKGIVFATIGFSIM